MFNISEKTRIAGKEILEEKKIKLSHIQKCLYDKNLHGKAEYSYFGTKSSKGNILLHTSKGDLMCYFSETGGWATELKFEEKEVV